MPDDDAHQTFRRESLRIRFRDFFVVMFTATLCLAYGLAYAAAGVRSPLAYAAAVPAAVAVLVAIGVLVLRRQFTVGLSPEGLRCCDFWGKYADVPWAAVRRATVWHLLGLPYLRIEAGGFRTLWMSLSLERADDLPDLFASYVDADHPLRRAIRP